MSEREVNRDSVTGQFVTDEYAAEHPESTVTEVIVPSPTRLAEVIAEIVTLTDSVPVLRVTAIGDHFEGTDPLDVYERVLVAVERRVEEQADAAT